MKFNNFMNKIQSEYSPKEIIRDLISLQQFLPGFLGLNKDYNDIVRYFIDLDLNDKNTPRPSVNEIQEKLGVKYGVLKRKLFELRNDIVNHERFGINFSINQVEYVFLLEKYEKLERLTLNFIPIVPRVGEQVQIPFFKSTLGTDYFYVRKINHLFNDTKQTIEITLTYGDYNLFWHFKKDEEYEKGNITFHEYFSTIDLLLKEKLGIKK